MSRLRQRIRREILENGPISFARFMDLALYDPDDGYYSHGPDRLGPEGDFFTASDAGHAFGRCIARQLAEVDRREGPFGTFHTVEFGAGRGLLARDVLDAASDSHPELASRMRYTLVDRSERMREAALAQAPEAIGVCPDRVPQFAAGCVLAVELFDALPVHRIRNVGGRRVEVRIGLGPSDRLVEIDADLSPDLVEHAVRYGAAPIDGSEAEVCPGAAGQLARMAQCLDKGVFLIVDYGDRAEKLYRDGAGTLLAYHRHGTNQDYLERIGEQDLTSHVNFSVLEDAAEELNLRVHGLTTQDRFLVANGIIDEFEHDALAEARDPARIKRRLQAMQLIHPQSMGRRFKVLVLSKGCPTLQLDGMRDPFAR